MTGRKMSGFLGSMPVADTWREWLEGNTAWDVCIYSPVHIPSLHKGFSKQKRERVCLENDSSPFPITTFHDIIFSILVLCRGSSRWCSIIMNSIEDILDCWVPEYLLNAHSFKRNGASKSFGGKCCVATTHSFLRKCSICCLLSIRIFNEISPSLSPNSSWEICSL